jgi:hypothetical protein
MLTSPATGGNMSEFPHKFVNVGFYTETLVCKYCDCKKASSTAAYSCEKHPDRLKMAAESIYFEPEKIGMTSHEDRLPSGKDLDDLIKRLQETFDASINRTVWGP